MQFDNSYQCYEEPTIFSFSIFFYPDKGGSRFLQHVNIKSTKHHSVITQKTIIFTIAEVVKENGQYEHWRLSGWFISRHLSTLDTVQQAPIISFHSYNTQTNIRYINPKTCMIQMNIKLSWTSREQRTGIKVLKCNFSIKFDQAQTVIRWCLRIDPFFRGTFIFL